MPFTNGLGPIKVAVLRDEKTSGTHGGTGNLSYVARNINSLQDPSGIILNSGSFTGTGGTNTQFQLGSGTYSISVVAPFAGSQTAGQVLDSKVRLQNITDSTTTTLGQTARSSQLSNGTSPTFQAPLEGVFTINGTKTFELQQRCSIALATIGFGQAINFGDNEVYTMIKIEKLD